jgi:hypothetical protein
MIVAIGYIASAFLAYSLIATNAIKFRWLNIFGCIFFIIYGLVISAFPVLLANTILLCINVYQLIKLYKYNEQFKLVEVTEENNIVQQFLQFYQTDINNYFPNFSFTKSTNKVCFVVLRDLAIANLFVAQLEVNGNAIIEINYTTPNYRDFKVGTFLFKSNNNHLIKIGVQQIVYEMIFNKEHLHFLKVMGFIEQDINGKKCIVKKLT